MSQSVVYVRSAFSRTHVAVELDGELLPSTTCDRADLDVATREVVYSLAEIDAGELCRRCFPHISVQGPEGTGTA